MPYFAWAPRRPRACPPSCGPTVAPPSFPSPPPPVAPVLLVAGWMPGREIGSAVNREENASRTVAMGGEREPDGGDGLGGHTIKDVCEE